MADALNLIFVLAYLAFPFVAMPLMWRRMKRVRRQSYDRSDPLPQAAPWREPIRTSDGLSLDRAHSPNEELIALGDKERQARWPLDNQ